MLVREGAEHRRRHADQDDEEEQKERPASDVVVFGAGFFGAAVAAAPCHHSERKPSATPRPCLPSEQRHGEASGQNCRVDGEEPTRNGGRAHRRVARAPLVAVRCGCSGAVDGPSKIL